MWKWFVWMHKLCILVNQEHFQTTTYFNAVATTVGTLVGPAFKDESRPSQCAHIRLVAINAITNLHQICAMMDQSIQVRHLAFDHQVVTVTCKVNMQQGLLMLQPERQSDRQTEIQTNKQQGRQAYRQTDSQRDSQTNKQSGKQ